MNGNDKYNVCIFGASLDVGNMGCRALSVSLIKLILESNSDAEINLLYGNFRPDIKLLKISGKDIQVNVINSRTSPRAKINEHIFWILFASILYRLIPIKIFRKTLSRNTPWINKIESADFIGDIRGGDSFSDIYGVGNMIIGSIPCFITMLLKKELVLLPQTYGPYSANVSKFIAKNLFNYSKAIFSRDKKSIEVVKTLIGNTNKNIKFCPDVAFSLDPVMPEIFRINPPLIKNTETTLIGVNVSGLLYNGGFTRNNMFGLKFDYKSFIEILIRYLLDGTHSEIILIPHTFSSGIESDYDACSEIFMKLSEKYPDKIHLLFSQHDQNEIKGVIGLCDFFIGSRMHSCIAALSQKIPCIGIAYSRKFAGIFSTAGVEDCAIDAREMTGEQVLIKCFEIFNNRYEIREILNKNIPCIVEELTECFRNEVLPSRKTKIDSEVGIT